MRPLSLQTLIAIGAVTVSALARTESPDLPRLVHAWSPTDAAMIDFDCHATGHQHKIACGFSQVSILRHLSREAMAEQLKEVSTPEGQNVLAKLCKHVRSQTQAELQASLSRDPPRQQERMGAVFNACLTGDLAKATEAVKRGIIDDAHTCSVIMLPRKTETFQRVDANTWIAQLELGQRCGESVTMTAWRSAPGGLWTLKNVKTVPPTAGSRCVIGEQVVEFREDTGIRDLGCLYFTRFPTPSAEVTTPAPTASQSSSLPQASPRDRPSVGSASADTASLARKPCPPVPSPSDRQQTVRMTRAVDGSSLNAEVNMTYESNRAGQCVPLVLVGKLPPFPDDFDSTITFVAPDSFCSLFRASGGLGGYAYGRSLQNRGPLHSCTDVIVIDPRLF
jgi:hypothetical protein